MPSPARGQAHRAWLSQGWALVDVLCALCVSTTLSWRSSTGVVVAVGWGKAGKVRQAGHEEQEKQDVESKRRRKGEVGVHGCSCTFQTTGATWNWELLSLSLTTNSYISVKYNLWGNSVIFLKIVQFTYHICISWLICIPIPLSCFSCI